jgi:hypothetical protein
MRLGAGMPLAGSTFDNDAPATIFSSCGKTAMTTEHAEPFVGRDFQRSRCNAPDPFHPFKPAQS